MPVVQEPNKAAHHQWPPLLLPIIPRHLMGREGFQICIRGVRGDTSAAYDGHGQGPSGPFHTPPGMLVALDSSTGEPLLSTPNHQQV